jgi:hypothetical protein
LPQVSSKTAVVTGPISAGSWVNWTPIAQSLELPLDVIDGKGGERNAVFDQRLLEGLGGGVLVRLEQELGSLGLVGGDDGEPACSPIGMSAFFTSPSTSV